MSTKATLKTIVTLCAVITAIIISVFLISAIAGISSIKVASADPESTGYLTVSILSPANDSSFVSLLVNDSFPDVSFPLIYETNEPPSWIGYSIDGSSNVTVSANDTIVEVTPQLDSYNLTLYANDTLGNWATPQTIHFSIARTLGTAPPPTLAPSPTVTPTPTPVPSPSPTPTSTPSTYVVSSPSQTDTTITLTWNGVAATNLGILESYEINESTSQNGTFFTIATCGYPQTSYTVTGLSPNTTYFFIVQYNLGHFDLNQSATSNLLEVNTTPTIAPAPSSSPILTTIQAKTDDGETVDLTLSGNITTSQLSDVEIAANQSTSATTVSFTVTGQSGTLGFCNMTIPKSAVAYGTTPTIYIDSQIAQNQGYAQDSDNYYVWYTTGFSTHQVNIVFAIAPNSTPSPSIPEFPAWILLALIITIALTVAAVICRKGEERKKEKRN